MRRKKIQFIGVWDTVEAYGFPVTELAKLWDRWIFPLRFVDKKLPCNVQRACHALAIDDERYTFHPVLWDQTENDSDRIEQVWFPGVHSDVGGGYARNNLALVTLDWMISKVEDDNCKTGLRFIPEIRKDYERRSDWHGVQHNSRSGIQAYYRYKPREIAQICEKVGICKPRIHRAALERIKHNIVPYAPTGLPANYEVVATRCKDKDKDKGTKHDYECSCQAEKREKAMEAARDVVFWRRWLHGAFVLATLIFAFSLWTGKSSYNVWWVTTIAVFAVLFVLKSVLSRATQIRAANAWAKLKGKSAQNSYPCTLSRAAKKLQTFLGGWPKTSSLVVGEKRGEGDRYRFRMQRRGVRSRSPRREGG